MLGFFGVLFLAGEKEESFLDIPKSDLTRNDLFLIATKIATKCRDYQNAQNSLFKRMEKSPEWDCFDKLDREVGPLA
jgi:hypothetical protein